MKYFIQTYGCQMNYHDSERMSGILERDGFERAAESKNADVILVNTCAVREKPERKLFAELGRLRKIKEKNPHAIIGVTGCMAPRDNDVIREKAPWLDFLLGPRSLHRLSEVIHSISDKRGKGDHISVFDDPTPVTPVHRSSRINAWVDIMFGCNYQCTYCAVPSARGKELSRPPQEIFNEIDDLVKSGYKEVMLLGQTVNAWGRDHKYSFTGGFDRISHPKQDFSWLLEEIDKRYPDLRVRFTSPHPQLFNERLIESVASIPTVCEHLHLPLQSASDEVLRNMKRSYTYEKFREIVKKLRDKIPNIGITTDIIVGFPGETEEQFEMTLNSLQEIEFDQAFMFAYSPRRHTEAYSFEDEVADEIKKARLQKLIEKANTWFNIKNKREIGTEFEVLVERESEKNPEKLTGRTRTNKTIVFPGTPDLTGQFVNVLSEEAFLWGFSGKVVEK